MKYNYKYIETKWYKIQQKINFFLINKNKNKKFYILNMFPYPSGYGLHLGHSIGYIFSDIISKYKSALGYNILNPIGFDSFGLPAEQYAIKTGNNPKYIINKSIKKYLKQIKLLGVIFNCDNYINTSDEKYYKWTQYIFIKLFNSYYDNKENKAKPIKLLLKKLKKKNNTIKIFKKLNKFYRLAYLKSSYVNWCPKLKSVLANDEIKNGKSIRGGYSIYPKKMNQWHLRITKYIPRLLTDYKYIDWPKNIINSQKKWIGQKNIYYFKINFINKIIKIYTNKKSKKIKSFIFNYPSKYVDIILNKLKKEKKKKIIKFINKCYYNLKHYKILIKIKNNLNKKILFYISNYYKNYYLNNVYINYKLDIKFKKIKTNLSINFKSKYKIFFLFYYNKTIINSLKDIVFSRQRYWGEPIPIYYINNIPFSINLKYLPLKLPLINKNDFLSNKFKLNKCKKWAWDSINKKVVYNKYINKKKKIYRLDYNTMPSSAGSNWYYLRYINPTYKKFLLDKKSLKFWENVDLYIGGAEHTNGHLLYSRFCNKFLKDLKLIKKKEPFKKFINQGIILNTTYSLFKYKNYILSSDILDKYKKYNLEKIYIDKKYLNNNILLLNKIKNNFKNYIFKYKINIICNKTIEKMSKSKYNIITPDSIIKEYGIDCFRLYIIYLGPFNKKKIWSIDKIKGIKRFLNKLWNYFILYYNKKSEKFNNKDIEKINNYIYRIHYNYKHYLLYNNISVFMKILNFLIKGKFFNIKSIIKKDLLILLFPYIPYIIEEIWSYLFPNEKSLFYQRIKKIKKKILNIKYLVMINNKIKDIIYITPKNNNLNYLLNKIKNKLYYKNNKLLFTKKIFIKNKVLNLLI
ncbi:MAG: class I tRNA ligase family protein [Candidatus Shikimatogenerans bostrichidophilus]|nr:MAG: class I tRNA ligase family protein [Candidatus Shikimatogenerans bostrichidophilus]